MAASEETVLEQTNPPEEGPSSLREALIEAYEETTGETETAPESTDSEPTSEEPELSTSEQHEAEESPSEETQGEDETVIQAPEHWSDEDKATFTELPSAARDYLLKREKQYEQGIQKKSEELKPIEEAFSAYDESLKLRGIDRTTAIRSWIAAQQALDQDPVSGLKMLINTYGPDIQERLSSEFGQQTQDDDAYDTPEITKLKEELQQTRQQTQQVNSKYEQLRQQEALEQVRQFKEATDDSGKPLHPFFEEAQSRMQALLNSGAASDLEAAYEQSVWAIPEYREQFTKAQVDAARKEEAKKRSSAAAKAKKTATTVTGKSSKPPVTPKPKSLKDDLRNAWDDSIKGDL